MTLTQKVNTRRRRTFTHKIRYTPLRQEFGSNSTKGVCKCTYKLQKVYCRIGIYCSTKNLCVLFSPSIDSNQKI